ncbi:phosphate ABC transporter permease subunit PstC [Tuberibacillus sp. Marseille-P3662]|uniref:phosphate ABC transporter permease subunit PstC n=1 Tax=Tuberibacillus sp. Marseille-P3662 TaxID=1965358 RepID=UPI000A1CB18D|nr:phosphate ABC transporter permease subunit PstC [Tuberibacillus sp. Marseille-P3662]
MNSHKESGQQSVNVTPASERLLSKNKSNKNGEFRGKIIIFSSAFFILAATVAITLFLTIKGLQSFVIDGLNVVDFMTGMEWYPKGNAPTYGAFPFIFGSFAVTFLSAIVAAPLGIGSALFMTEITKKWGQKILQPVIEILVGIPSVVYGLVGLLVIVPVIRSYFGGTGFGLLAGTIVVGIMVLPTVTSISVDTLKSVPEDLKNASYALGATRWQTIYKVVIPAVLPSLLTAVVLGMARAFGEALAVQMVIGNTKTLPDSLVEPAATLTTIITLSMGHTTYGSTLNHALWTLGLVLLVMSYVFIMIIRFLSRRRQV